MAQKKYVSLEKLGLYDEKIKSLINSKDSDALASAKSYADGLADNYEKAGSVATAKEALQKNIDAVEAKADAASAANTATQSDLDKLEALVGTIPEDADATDVVGYVDEKTAGIATESAVNALASRVTQAEGDIDAIEADYLKAADKTELNDLITAEAATARAAEKKNADAIAAISADYLKATDKTTLETSIAAAKKAGDDAQADIDAFLASAEIGDAAIDTLKEIQDYITSDGAAAATMTTNIKQNADDIDALETAVAQKASQSDLQFEISARTSADSALDARLQAVESAVGESGSVADDIATAKNEAIAVAADDATAKDTALETKITAAYKAYADAEDEKIESRVATLETASATHALASDLTALAGRVTTAEGEIDTLQTDLDAAEAQVATNKSDIAALQTTVAGKVAQSDFDTLSAKVTANTTAIGEFIEVSEAEVLALFN